MSTRPVHYRITNPNDRVHVVGRKMHDVLVRSVSGKGGIRAISPTYFNKNYRLDASAA